MNIPDQVKTHLQGIFDTAQGEWSKSGDSFDKLCGSWEKKERLFTEQISLLGMEEVKTIDASDTRGMLFLTFSGSLLSLGCGEKRWMEYASIKLRTDVPDILRVEETSLASAIEYGQAAKFTQGPLKNTSALYRIVCCGEGVSENEQEKRIREATVFLTNSFIHLNRDLTLPMDQNESDQFNKQNMIAYIARKHGLSQEKIRELTEDYMNMVETGMLMGKTISLGRIGRFSLSLKPRRKARLGRNPKTGEEITIPARDAHWSPSFKFSTSSKEKASRVLLPPQEDDL